MKFHSHARLEAEVCKLILQTFRVTRPQARQHASELVAIARGWGGVVSPAVDWQAYAKRQLGGSLTWRSEIERRQFIGTRAQRF